MATIREDILISAELENNISKAANVINKDISELSTTIGKTTTSLDNQKVSTKEYNKSVRDGKKNLIGFQAEQLGVMFAGMALNRAMANLSATSREWVGISDLMSTAMGIVLLPTTMDLLNFGVIPLFDALTDLPEPAKKAIGLLALSLEGLGAIMFTGGQLALGLNSTHDVLAKLAGVSPSLIFTEKGLSALKTKLGGTIKQIKRLGKIAGVGIALSIAVNDLEEGNLTAAIGAATLGVGIATGNPYLIGVGVVLKIAGEPEFLAEFLVFGLKIIDIAVSLAEDIVEAIWSAVSRTKPQFKFLDSFGEEMLKSIESADFKSGSVRTVFQVSEISNFEGAGKPFFKPNEQNFNREKVTFIQNNTITGFDMTSVQKEINKNNQALTAEVRRIIKI